MKALLTLLFIAHAFISVGQAKVGDNLGNHKANKDLEMNSQRILNAAAVAIGGTAISNSSISLELHGSDKALRINRVPNLSAIIIPVDGMLVYNSGDNRFYQRMNGIWNVVAGITDFTWTNISGKPSFATVATSGNYNDLSNRPTIPTALSQLINDPGFITSAGRAYPRRADGNDINFHWSGQSGQPASLLGSNDGTNYYVWTPSNLSVNYANSAGSATTATNATNATYGRYVYDNGFYTGGRSPSWIEPTDLGVRYSANSGALGGNGPLDYLGKEGNNHYQQRTWIAVQGDFGFYFPGATGFSATPYVYPTNSTYGVLRIDGYKNGFTGNYLSYAGMNTGMYDIAGNGGEYNSVSGIWYTYFNRANTCLAINGSNTSSTYAMYLNGKGLFAAGSSAIAGQLDVSGEIVGFSSLPSDARLKKNLKRISGASNLVKQLNGYFFQWKKDGTHDMGLKAQEVEQVLPEIVKETKLPFQSHLGEEDETTYKVVQYEKLIALLIEAQKEQIVKVDELIELHKQKELKIKSLIKRVAMLEKKLPVSTQKRRR